MKLGFYPRLAWDGIRKNRRLYLPYFLTCSGMILMLYIIHYLAAMPSLRHMPGGDTTLMMLGFGVWIVALFALIFLLYTNSFLMRRRRKEFGLYHMLGMGKRNLCILLLWETVILYGLSMAAGLFGGILFSKLAELCLMAVIDGSVTYTLHLDTEALLDTVLVFSVIFAVLFLKGVISLQRLSAVSLLQSESVGEKPPKANYLLGSAGIVLLAIAYYIAVSIENPIAALAWFFIAVGLVIVGTYLLFIAGSVMLCRLLQKNKRYYYKKNHFVSVSSMAYRMKRNGAGLASICILSTMVLVMMMGAGSLYFGSEESLRTRYPHDISVSAVFPSDAPAQSYSEEKVAQVVELTQAAFTQSNAAPVYEMYYTSCCVSGILQNGTLVLDPAEVDGADLDTLSAVSNLCILSLADYNRCLGAQETLEEDEILLHCLRRTYDDPTITLPNGTRWRVKSQPEQMVESGYNSMLAMSTVYLVVPELETAIETVQACLSQRALEVCPVLNCSYDFDLDAEAQIALAGTLREQYAEAGHLPYAIEIECREAQRSDFYGSFGGIFFLAIILSVVFLTATVLIIYYKQVSEGYEDEARFGIMRKVGMTAKDIRKSINSQMLLVFFLPLLTAALHVCFAFPMVLKLLTLFSLYNTMLTIKVSCVAFVIFGVFYAVIYRITSNAYYAIVSGRKEE